MNIEKPKINDCIRIVESVVDFALGKHNAITNHIYSAAAANKSVSAQFVKVSSSRCVKNASA